MNPLVTVNGKAITTKDWEYSAKQIKAELVEDTKRQLIELTSKEKEQVDQATD